MSDPQVTILITLYNPTGEGGHQGGGVAAPIASQILGEVLPCLELQYDKEIDEQAQDVEVPEIRGVSINEARKILKEKGLELQFQEGLEGDSIINEQEPKPGIIIKEGQKVEAK